MALYDQMDVLPGRRAHAINRPMAWTAAVVRVLRSPERDLGRSVRFPDAMVLTALA
jgi:hypothetical protein